MPIRIIPVCRHCGLLIESTEPMGAWIHTGLSIYCPGSGAKFTATPVIEARPRRPRSTANGEECAEFEENGSCIHSDHTR